MIEEENTQRRFEQKIQNIEPYLNDVSSQRFSELLKKMEQLSRCVQNTKSFQGFYKIIGLNRETVIAGLHAIYEYFVLLGSEIDKGLIKRHVGQRLIEGVHKYLEIQNFSELEGRNKALYILEFQTKFSVCLQFFHTIKDQQTNITSEDQSLFQNVWRSIEFVSLGDGKQIQKKYNSVKKMLTLTTTAILTQEEVQWSISKKILFGLSYPRSLIDYNTSRLKSFIFYKYPTIKLAKNIWNIPELGASKELIKMVFENIAVNKKIFIPLQCEDDEYPDILTNGQGKVQVRILNHEQLHFKTKPAKKSKLFCCHDQQEDQSYKQIDTIMIHMHGGGFIALSSRMMQTMTRRWANKLKIPIFSIDYRKPPTDPFPAAPNDCLAVYKFIVSKIKRYMNINPVNIYLAGDSAGGNLSCSLMGNILKNNLTIPKGIYLAYPALDLRVKFSPSKIHAVTDPLLWPSMLILCLNQYLGGNIENALNPIASPILLTEEFVGGERGDKRFPLKWPKTYISVGEIDPLYDDSLLLMQKMKQSQVQCKCRVYKQLSHGFLSTNLMISECQLTIRDSISDLKKLIDFKEKPLKKPKKSTSMKEQKQNINSQNQVTQSKKGEPTEKTLTVNNEIIIAQKAIQQQIVHLERQYQQMDENQPQDPRRFEEQVKQIYTHDKETGRTEKETEVCQRQVQEKI